MSSVNRISGVVYYEWTSNSLQCGHVSLRLNDGTYVSLWQMSPLWRVLSAIGLSSIKTNVFVILIDYVLSLIVPFMRNKYCTMSYEQDVMIMDREADKRITFHGSFLDEEYIKQWWKQINNTLSYGLMTCNCSTIVFRALSAGGATDYVDDPDYLIWTPYRLYKFCERLQWKTYNVLNGRIVETNFEYILKGLKTDAQEEKEKKQEIKQKKEELKNRQEARKEGKTEKKENDPPGGGGTEDEKETDTETGQDHSNEDVDLSDFEVVPEITGNSKTTANEKHKPKKRMRKRRK